MRNPFKNLQEELHRQLPEAQARYKRVTARPKSKEARTENRKFGLLLVGLSVLMTAPQILALLFDDTYYPRLAIMSVLVCLFGLFILLTGWLPKKLRR
jgi:hypothetical protein